MGEVNSQSSGGWLVLVLKGNGWNLVIFGIFCFENKMARFG